MINLLCINCSKLLSEKLQNYIDMYSEYEHSLTIENEYNSSIVNHNYNPIIIGSIDHTNINETLEFIKDIFIKPNSLIGRNKLVFIEDFNSLDNEVKYLFRFMNVRSIEEPLISASNII